MKNVLFVCTHSAGRSQMAQAFFNRHSPHDVRAESAGAEPARAVWPVVVRATEEVGIDLSGERPKRLLPEMQLHADWAVTLACGGACPYVPGVVEDWEVPDPAGRPIAEVRACAEAILARYDDAKVRSYVLLLAERETRECLAGEVCHALTAVG
jgi:arsenate reductase